MALVIVCGQPCSGKSTIAAKLSSLLASSGSFAVVVDEPSLSLDRNVSYTNSANEKIARGALKSAVERVISQRAVTVVDSLNSIKGYRYELWCIARASATRYCLVHVETPHDTCVEWNEARGHEGYSAAIFQDLWGRFETPDHLRNRWDAPLFIVRPAGEESEVVRVLEEVVDAVTGKQGPDPNAVAARTLRPTMATTNPALLATNTLHDIDAAAQDVVNAIVAAQADVGGAAAGRITFGEGVPTLDLHAPVGMAELRRLKRSFLKLATKITFSRLQGGASAKKLFVEFLDRELHPS